MTDHVLVSTEGRLGRLRLNRPRVLHAMTQAMCEGMSAALSDWRGDHGIDAVLIDHSEGRGFCAGGDVRAAADSGRGDGVAARGFFRAEYQLNHQLFTYAKPVVAIMDGVTMGGGVGIAAPARYRVATENTLFAMPETAIGLYPDAGGGWHLSRLPGRVGEFLALTGARLDGAECLSLGLATHYLPSDALPRVKAAIAADPQSIPAILDGASVPPPPARIERNRGLIDRLFAADRLEDILAALAADPSDWAAKELATLAAKSPQACKVALRLLATSRDFTDFADEMRLEYAITAHVCQRHDFIEGVRALLVDKDRTPRWNPATPEGVTDHMLDIIFAPLADDEAWRPLDR